MILEERDSGTAHWQASLIVVLGNYAEDNDMDNWLPLVEACDAAAVNAQVRWGGDPLSIKTMSNLRRRLITDKMVEQRQVGKHYQLRLTEKGTEAYDEILENPDWGTPDSDTMVKVATAGEPLTHLRIGSGHKLPREVWGMAMKQLEAGIIDFVTIPHAATTKAKYWE